MAVGPGVDNRSDPVPAMPSPNENINSVHVSALSSSSSSISDTEHDRKSRADRPRLASRKPSASILVPRDHPEIEIEKEEFPPDDARAMSPRRNSADVEKLSREAREALQKQANTLQSSLQALAERIDEVKSDHDKLENENRFLQDYIGGLTRTMSAKTEVTSTSGVGKGKKQQK
ncbi:bZIP transcription factor [Histoplasma capsulatum var. duboisii H88]|uniref:BZIP transcription factor n=4 Tax=Ajellomyces capsulatus TaxID=5037 RepID=C0NBG3_AJECG|nr:uncharacterized protein HCBG_00459 [Histoplasma capsulatum G186AR]EER43041.1 bZIP transcription factor [Histoplasma capsulatum H143]EGC45972.1 bZIP transcription factor [Histoplasma capsulatum var. duboisii H88]KAG5303146.1 bZIP transcription factor [Histoplasma capsulatum]EEH11004.1 conserved hypothetical protein [Histoplasma capsulatum G186AR]QSS56605.1 bZIP transcription factor [Histoplasma capsulatum var. duboisii H88]